MTNAIPFFAGRCRSNSIAASNPPAEPPTPTIGQDSGFPSSLERVDFGWRAFAGERNAPCFSFGCRAIAVVIVNRASSLFKLRLLKAAPCEDQSVPGFSVLGASFSETGQQAPLRSATRKFFSGCEMPGSIYEAAGEIGAVRSEVGEAECGHRNPRDCRNKGTASAQL